MIDLDQRLAIMAKRAGKRLPYQGRGPGDWHHHIIKAKFETFTWRDAAGRMRFRGQQRTGTLRFRDRVWPVFYRGRPKWRRTDAWDRSQTPLWLVFYDRSMERAHRIEEARHWWVNRPLQRQWDRIDEAIKAGRGTRA